MIIIMSFAIGASSGINTVFTAGLSGSCWDYLPLTGIVILLLSQPCF
ncbi:hypothetical protein MJ575_11595 [Klebsiella pneumoniae]|nr:hypothetical protein MJ575_11595 [Klebsiella pneumoniae]